MSDAQAALRICNNCNKQIIRHDKWQIIDSTISHRNCADPTSYFDPTRVDNSYGLTYTGSSTSKAGLRVDTYGPPALTGNWSKYKK